MATTSPGAAAPISPRRPVSASSAAARPRRPDPRRRLRRDRRRQRRPRLAPSGRHILGSAQVRVEHARRGLGRLGRLQDRARPHLRRRSSRSAATPSSPNPPSACRSTAGRAQAAVFDEIHAWWRANQDGGQGELLFGYALGKAQRLIAGLDPSIGPDPHARRRRADERALPRRRRAAAADHPRGRPTAPTWKRAIVIAPPSADGSPWARRFGAAVHRVRLGLDGDPRHAPPARGGPRLRALGPRRLAQPARRHRGHRAPSGSGSRTATPACWSAGCASRGVDAEALETRYEGERDDADEPAGDAIEDELRRPR